MEKENGYELHIWKDRIRCEDLNYDEILLEMCAEASREGYLPCDLNYIGRPNIYLRGMYEGEKGASVDSFKWLKDGFIMFVQKTGNKE